MGIKRAIVAASEEDTSLLMRGYNTLRVYKNSAARAVLDIERTDPDGRKAISKWMRPDGHRSSFETTGDADAEVWSIGQAMGLVDDVPPCKELLERIVAEAAEQLSRSVALVSKL